MQRRNAQDSNVASGLPDLPYYPRALGAVPVPRGSEATDLSMTFDERFFDPNTVSEVNGLLRRSPERGWQFEIALCVPKI